MTLGEPREGMKIRCIKTPTISDAAGCVVGNIYEVGHDCDRERRVQIYGRFENPLWEEIHMDWSHWREYFEHVEQSVRTANTTRRRKEHLFLRH